MPISRERPGIEKPVPGFWRVIGLRRLFQQPVRREPHLPADSHMSHLPSDWLIYEPVKTAPAISEISRRPFCNKALIIKNHKHFYR